MFPNDAKGIIHHQWLMNPRVPKEEDAQAIEELKAAYRAVLENSQPQRVNKTVHQPKPMRKIPFLEALQQAQGKPMTSGMDVSSFTSTLPQQPVEDTPRFSFATGLLKQPKWLAGLAISLCLMASVAYASLGYWWLLSETPSHAAQMSESVNMLNMDGTETPSEHAGFENLQKLQIQSKGGIVVPNEKAPEPESFNLIAAAKSLVEDLIPGIPAIQHESVGRSDPFAPLVKEQDVSDAGPEQPKDILESVSYTGFIGDINAKDKVAIIRMSDMGMERTLVKKVGEFFTVDGEKIILKEITKNTLVLSAQGKPRHLSLTPYVDTTSASAVGASGSSPAAVGAPSGNSNNTSDGGSEGKDRPRNGNPELKLTD